jgi:hypothetical protein
MSVSYGGDSITFADGSVTSSGFIGHRNRIINGGMVIVQRGTAASNTNNTFPVDRFRLAVSASSKVNLQQSSTVPTGEGFVNSVVATSLAATTVGSTDTYEFSQQIEGYNTADLMWGTAAAKTVTLSFWVRSSLTGTFGGTFENSGNTRAYPFSYTISAADTWQKISITVAGDTSGTWLTDNSRGIIIRWSLGCGSSFLTTANAWAAGDYQSVTGETKLVATNGATWYLTGVQLERGSTASSFEYRPLGTELALCQRYFYQWSAANANSAIVGSGQAFGGTSAYILMKTPMTMRIPPTTFSSAGSFGSNNASGGGLAVTALSLVSTWTNENMITLQPTVSSGWVAGNAAMMNAGADANCRLNFSAEL